jgi:uncharacterized protein (UPF0335 family)
LHAIELESGCPTRGLGKLPQRIERIERIAEELDRLHPRQSI